VIRPPGESSPPESAGHPGSPRLTRLIGWLAVAAIAASTLIMIVISAAGPNVSVPAMSRPGGGPPWWHPLHLTATVVTVSLWTAMALGCAGVIAGLVAVLRRPVFIGRLGGVLGLGGGAGVTAPHGDGRARADRG